MKTIIEIMSILPKRIKENFSRIYSEMAIVRQHFDAEYYLLTNDDVKEAEKDPLRHFCEFGWKEGRNPTPNFSCEFYLNLNPDVLALGINPYVHFLTVGKVEGRLEGFVLESTSVKDKIEAIRGDFDSEFYLSENPDVASSGVDPVEHYIVYGWLEGRNPTADFSTDFYLETYSDIKAARVNPFWHYLMVGKAENRLSSPTPHKNQKVSEVDKDQLDRIVDIISPHFDEMYYRENYKDAVRAGISEIRHFCEAGWKEGKNPSANFSVKGYLDLNPDVASSGVNPLWHYIVAGRYEQRSTISVDLYKKLGAQPKVETSIAAIKDQFDTSFYTFKYADVAASKIEPIEHYWNNGWKEGRDPNANFSTSYYLDTNPDVAELGINPFWHYVVAGKLEGRLPQHPGGHRVERLRTLDTLEDEARRWGRKENPTRLLGSGQLSDLILKARHDGSRELLLSVGHDHYRKVSGGVQLCEHREEAISSTNGRIYLYLYPYHPLPRLAHLIEEADPILCLIMNGEDIGYCRMSDLLKSISTVSPELQETTVVIHQLLGHAPENIAKLIKVTGKTACWLWLHDFLTICPSYTLQRNGVSFCGAPPLGSNACSLCRYGEERRSHFERISVLFDEIEVHVLSPSEVTAATWLKRSGLSAASLTVIPHMRLKWGKRTTPPPKAGDKITICFLGTPAPHKGWNVFERLVRTLEKSSNYRFLFLGASSLPANGIDHVPVHVTAENPDAMIEAVRDEKIDFVVHWASWPETFSLSTFEAYAGGAYVLTNSISGNVAATVDKLKRGVVLKDEAELFAFFESERAENLINYVREDRRKNEVRHQLSRMVHDAIDLFKSEEKK